MRGPGLAAAGEPYDIPPTWNERLATVAHELRNPLAAVLLALQSIPGDRAAAGPLAVAERQARRAARLVDDLFDVCAGSLGKLSVRPEVLDLKAVVEGAARAAECLLVARRHRLAVSLPPRPVAVVADPLRLEQVLTNLLANAAKFTDPGGDIRLAAGVKAGQVVLRVRDNGRGVASDQLPRVFDPFHQCEAPGHSGLGIGLTLVRALVHLHGGTVEASSDGPGTGSEFVVRLPLVATPRPRTRF